MARSHGAQDGAKHISEKVKEPGSLVTAGTIQRKILPGEKLMCSSCYQQRNTQRKVHHAVPALALHGCTFFTVACALCVLQAAAKVKDTDPAVAAAGETLTSLAHLPPSLEPAQPAALTTAADAETAIGVGDLASGSTALAPAAEAVASLYPRRISHGAVCSSSVHVRVLMRLCVRCPAEAVVHPFGS